MGKSTLEKAREDIKKGKRNFLSSEEDFILHYCAYKFLCEGGFSYHLTDISKGLLTSGEANRKRESRYRGWFPLLEQELELLGNPTLIAVGKGTYDHLKDVLPKRAIENYVWHYSWMTSGCIKRWYQGNGQQDCPLDSLDNVEDELERFAKILLDHIEYPLKEECLKKVFSKSMPDWKKRLFIYYQKKFSVIEAKNSR